MTENELATMVINASMKIHTRLGPGLFESVYESILAFELSKMGLSVERQVPIPILWEGMLVDEAFRADLIVEKLLLIELKSTHTDSPVFKKQVITYLKISGLKLGLLINFGQPYLKNGICRLVNGLNI